MISDNSTEIISANHLLEDHNYATNADVPSEQIPNNNTNSWQTMVSKRRPLDPTSSIVSKKAKQENVTSRNIKLHNSYDALSKLTDSDMDADVSASQTSEPKPPPIFIPNVGNVQAMVKTFESVVAANDFSYKCINNNSVKILPKSADIYRKLVRKLNESKVCFHTYQLKQERAYRVVLKHMHYSIDTNELKEALSQMGHTVRNITNVRHSTTKQPLSMFFIDLEPSPNNKDVFNIQYLLHAKITFEPPYKKKDIVQCKRCQQYGHTKSYCRHPFRCVKCGKDHDTANCTKDSSTPAVCALCGGDHPANYRGCTVFKSIQRRINPQLREKTERPKEVPEQPSISHTSRPTRPDLTYAKVVNSTQVSSNDSNVSASNALTTETTVTDGTINDSLTNIITKFFNRFENLFLQQSQQIGALLNLLSTVLQKLKYRS